MAKTKNTENLHPKIEIEIEDNNENQESNFHAFGYFTKNIQTLVNNSSTCFEIASKVSNDIIHDTSSSFANHLDDSKKIIECKNLNDLIDFTEVTMQNQMNLINSNISKFFEMTNNFQKNMLNSFKQVGENKFNNE